MENIYFLVLVAIVGIIRWVVQAAENKRNAEAAKRVDPQPSAPIQRAPAETEEERIRRFMEALGVPKGAAPPPPPRRVTSRPPKTIMPVDPFPIPRPRRELPIPAPSPAELNIPEQAAEPQQPAATLPLPTPQTSMLAPVQRDAPAAPEFAVEDAPREVANAAQKPVLLSGVRSGSSKSLVARLATAEGLRDAMVLREIFGPPRSMQPFDPARAT